MRRNALLTTAISIGAALTFVGCPDESDAEVEACIDDNPGNNPADFESDMWHIVCVTPADGTEVLCEPPTVSEIEADCAADGHGCEGQIAVTKAAARCIAGVEGLAEGLDGLHADLGYSTESRVPVWDVSNVLKDDGAGASEGKSLSISAVDGAVLRRSNWSAIP